MKQRDFAFMKLAASMFIFGTIGIFVRYIPLDSALISLCRAVIGFLSLLVIMIFKKKRFSFSMVRRNLIPLLLSGLFLGFNWLLLFESYRYTSVAVSTLCYYMAPILVILLSPFVLKEKLTLHKAICIVAALVGMMLISGIFQESIPSGNDLKGILLGLGAAVLYAAIVLLNQKLHGIDPFERTVFQLGLSALVLIPYCLLSCDFSSITLTWEPVLLLFMLGIVHTGLAYYLYFGSMERLPGQTVAMISYLDPAIAVLISVAILREPLKPMDIPGALLILGAAFLSEMSFGKEQTK